jgi:predicted AAA+ superfamily ATPase
LNIFANIYFWRTYDQKEVDLVEEREGKLFGFEFKWSDKKKKTPKLWLETYDNASCEIINKDNYQQFII